MWAVPNWRPWVHFHSSFFFFLILFPLPPPPLTCPQRHVFPSTMRSQSIPLMYSMHAIMFQTEGEGYWMYSSENIWLWPEVGEEGSKQGRWEKDLLELTYKAAASPRSLAPLSSSTGMLLCSQRCQASRSGRHSEGSYAFSSPLTFSQTKLFSRQI